MKIRLDKLKGRTAWFYFERYWGGKILHFGLKNYVLVVDIRKDWLADMRGEKK